MSTLLDLIRSAPEDKTAIILPERHLRISYGSLQKQVEAVADRFSAAGIGRDDRIAVALPNGLPAIVCVLAASVAGTAAPLNPAYREDEHRFYIDDTGARALVVPPDGGDEARRAAGDRVQILVAEMDAAGSVHVEGASGRRSAEPPGADDTAVVLHTSGSTGRPKRVPLRHRNLVVSAANVARTYDLGTEDISLCVMPLFHVHGLVASTLATLGSGGTVVVPAGFNPLSFWRIVRDHRVTWYSAVPTMHQLLLGRAGSGSDRFSGAEGLRFVRSCSAPLSPDMMEKLERRFGVPVLEAYGMTEAAHQMSSNPLPPGRRKPGSVGPGTGVRISIMDGDGHHLKSGQRGEVVIQGPNVIDGYENNPEANAASFTGGWFRTGDQGVIDADGYLTLVGRLKELINRGGEKISPREIDEVLLAHSAVQEAVCFGVRHSSLG